MNTTPVDVLVVGAGPVGLALAVDVAAHGGTVRVLERRNHPDRPSRAMIVHPRTLEVLRPLGVVDGILARADTSPQADIHVGRRVVPVRLERPELIRTSFPHLTMVRQADVEQVLQADLCRRGVTVEWGSELVALPDPGPDLVRATVRSQAAGIQDVVARFVVGCDGTSSTVRGLLGIGWPGRYYPVEVVLADVELSGAVRPGRLQVAVGSDGLVFAFALGEQAPWRVLATRVRGPHDPPPGYADEPVPVRELHELVGRAGLGAALVRVAWSARIPLQHRIARSFASGRVFLAGDAAHTHSPAGAQGMNSGLQDATNLGWKLAFAAQAGLRPTAPLLQSYELERRPVARQVLTLTDVVFAAEASPRLVPRLFRGRVLPVLAPLLPLATERPWLMSTALRILSQEWVRYRSSPLSMDRATGSRGVRPGDRLRDAQVRSGDGRTVRLHELTARPGVHVLLSSEVCVGSSRPHRFVAAHRLPSWPGSSVVAVRPDGHVGFRAKGVETLPAWLALAGVPPATDGRAVGERPGTRGCESAASPLRSGDAPSR
ncbi:MAG: FAD-dependent monooxygenase [Intrasporangium sp.]|uniref:FAD-dependent monooxygenase n=1 Tax=Intrasporangium sp. TaxID=1925024 RepID=UPI002649585C|nr:FAD-dependent monooxygenase [Intrasporangium sp.]MDN5795308.1 FAD-dependent monooxygenase [Intrasporangium sp.]